MNWKHYIYRVGRSHALTLAVVFVGGVLAVALIFHAGASWGERRAIERLHQRAGAPPPEFGFLPHSFMPEGHGAIGTITIISTSTPTTFTLHTREDDDVLVYISTSTVITGGGARSAADLLTQQTVVVLGSPADENELDAHVVRVLPPQQ